MTLSLFLAYAKSNQQDIGLRNLLVKLNLGLARTCAHRVKSKCDQPYKDLEQVAFEKLVYAVERFDPSKGVAFSSYAVPYISGGILQYIRDKGHLIRLTQQMQALEGKGRRVAERLEKELGRKPTLLEMATELEVPVTKLQEAIEAVQQSRSFVSVDDHEETLVFE